MTCQKYICTIYVLVTKIVIKKLNDMENLINEVIEVLRAFGYEPKVEKHVNAVFGDEYDIYFHVSDGSDSMKQRHKDSISMLVKGYLNEFYYESDTQHVRISDNICYGLEPDDGRYSCLIHEMIHVNDKILPDYEMFVNLGDRFQRLTKF